MAVSLAERTAQLEAERRLLLKADQDIEDGWLRIRDQEDRVRELMVGGTTHGRRSGSSTCSSKPWWSGSGTAS